MNKLILLVITLLSSILCGVMASNSTNVYWVNGFYISILYPIFLIILQIIIPILKK